jgi:hypothetical protein
MSLGMGIVDRLGKLERSAVEGQGVKLHLAGRWTAALVSVAPTAALARWPAIRSAAGTRHLYQPRTAPHRPRS